MSELVFFLPCSAKAGHAFKVANHTGSVIHILAVAMRTLKEGTLINVVTFVTNCNTYIETEVVTAS